ncbi:uncharacterized protein PG986_013254 [Apiospora aurea]|uniref:Uncharacterized protein n=1 Tax=Apiospora aurea TaxID=335848 RepID=A0ABR1PV30_9PEZI
MGGPNGICVNCDYPSNSGQLACQSNKGWQPNCKLSQNAGLAICGGSSTSQSSPVASSSSGSCGNVNPCSSIGTGPGTGPGGPGNSLTGPNGICVNCDYPSNKGQWACQNGYKSWQPNCKMDQHKTLAACGGSCPSTPTPALILATSTILSPAPTLAVDCKLPMNWRQSACSCTLPMNSGLPQCKPKATTVPSKPAYTAPAHVDCSNAVNFVMAECACTIPMYSTLARCHYSTSTITVIPTPAPATTPLPASTPESTPESAPATAASSSPAGSTPEAPIPTPSTTPVTPESAPETTPATSNSSPETATNQESYATPTPEAPQSTPRDRCRHDSPCDDPGQFSRGHHPCLRPWPKLW